MDGSASPAADVADTRGEDAPCEEEPGNAEETYQHEQTVYFPEELVDNWSSFSFLGLYYCYKISMRGCFNSTTAPTDLILAVKCDMGSEFLCNSFNLGGIEVAMEYVRIIHLNKEQVIFARRFQTTILSLLINNDHSKVSHALKYFHQLQLSPGVVYLLLPSVSGKVDWCSIKFSTSPIYEATDKDMRHCHSCKDADLLQTEDGPFCRCMLQNSIVYTPHNRMFYAVTGFLDLNANSLLHRNYGSDVRYKTHFKTRHGLNLTYEDQPLLAASNLFKVRNFLHKCHYKKEKEPSGRNAVELPPELCRVVMTPVSANTLCIFSFVPSIMYRIQYLLLSEKLKIQLGPSMQQFSMTALKTLEALTTNECQEEFSLESLETLGDSFLKYVTTQHLFSKYKLHREGVLTSMRDSLVSNAALCQLACNKNLVRLEFLGDAVLNHIFTLHFYNQYYPKCTPALLTNLRKASVNNCCYAHAAVKAGLHRHLLHSSSELKHVINDLENLGRSFSGPSHGWEPGIGLHEDLADLIESIAGAIYLDSKHDKEVVWRAMKRLLEPLATAENVEPDPVTEVKELCEHIGFRKPSYSRTREDGVTTVVAKVLAAGTVYSGTGTGRKKDVAKMFAAKALLQELKAAALDSPDDLFSCLHI
ncbi:endoribonuclease Dicer homolog 2a-like isoform X3 [Phragmites australis]|uniref:endoribonuclease Dicer homolog 2a-like isoform X3 n=1 Tax=Phragmites australis TaxID=29695 RepID=UPI002D7A06E8|nr:endoribonuclease Dicer homolog 2a-like isoform X3 [Phragmites australis]